MSETKPIISALYDILMPSGAEAGINPENSSPPLPTYPFLNFNGATVEV